MKIKKVRLILRLTCDLCHGRIDLHSNSPPAKYDLDVSNRLALIVWVSCNWMLTSELCYLTGAKTFFYLRGVELLQDVTYSCASLRYFIFHSENGATMIYALLSNAYSTVEKFPIR